jgi:gas vesicle protein
MSDQFRTTDQKGPGSPQGFEKAATQGFEKAATAGKNVTDQALSAGRDLKDKALGIVDSSTDALKDQASEFVDAAKDVASQATDKLKQTVDGQKKAGAEYVGNLADTMRRAAREFDGDLPIAGVYIRKAASQIEGVSDSIKTGNFQDLVRGAQSFAKRQPTAFLGLAVLAGFGAVRFLKSSANDSDVAQSSPGLADVSHASKAGSRAQNQS